MTLRTRKPTGRVPWPLILIEGPEKAGKSWMCAELSASDKVGQTYWIDLGEGSADEYGAIPGARYEIVEHNGTYGEILDAVIEIKDLAAKAADAGEPPVVLVIDSMTAEWDLLKGIADAKARERLARKGRRLAPDAEPQISMDLWNEANAKHRKLMTLLMTMPGIVVMTARGKEVAALDATGRPIEGSREYRVEGQKNLAFDASVWIRVSRDHPPLVVGARSVHAGVRPGVDRPVPQPGLTLERVIFDILRCQPGEAHVRDLVQPQVTAADLAASAEPGIPANRPVSGPPAGPAALGEIATRLIDTVANATSQDGLRQVWHDARRAHLAGKITGAEVELFKQRWQARHEQLDQQDHSQRKQMFALFSEADITDRDERLAYASEVVGRTVASTRELTADEVATVIDRLRRYVEQTTPPVDERQPAEVAA